MLELRFCKSRGWNHEPKFSIKHCNNGWHRFFEIIVPANGHDYLTGEVIRYQITYWNNYTNFWGKEKTNDSLIGPADDNNDTQSI
jgi:hypothetical protein